MTKIKSETLHDTVNAGNDSKITECNNIVKFKSFGKFAFSNVFI